MVNMYDKVNANFTMQYGMGKMKPAIFSFAIDYLLYCTVLYIFSK